MPDRKALADENKSTTRQDYRCFDSSRFVTGRRIQTDSTAPENRGPQSIAGTLSTPRPVESASRDYAQRTFGVSSTNRLLSWCPDFNSRVSVDSLGLRGEYFPRYFPPSMNQRH